MPISGPSGSYTGGPFKIVHHTTEGSSAQGAFTAFRTNRSDPHFTVDGAQIYQHIDTAAAARALRNPPGGVETNRDSAIQIEVVGFAHRPKILATLKNVQKLCNWLEQTHDIPKVWPNGPPKPAVNGRDTGGHNRNAANWDQKGGHYGHSQVPENTHWDPGYTATEAAFVLADAATESAAIGGLESIPLEDPGFESEVSHMPDHADPQGAVEEMNERAAIESATLPTAAKKGGKKKAFPKAAAKKATSGAKASRKASVNTPKKAKKRGAKKTSAKSSKSSKGGKKAAKKKTSARKSTAGKRRAR
jgi:hypothetical protein